MFLHRQQAVITAPRHIVHADGKKRAHLCCAHIADFAADHCTIRRGKRRQFKRGKSVLKQARHRLCRNGSPAEQRVQLIERRHHRVPNLRAILRFRRQTGGIQLVAHIFQRFIGVHVFQQCQNGANGVIRRFSRLQVMLQRQKRRHHLLTAFFQRGKFFFGHALGIVKRLAHGVAAHVGPFAVNAESIKLVLAQP